MRRRLRKKLRRGEFTEYGARVVAEWRTPIAMMNDVVDRNIEFADTIAVRGLYFGGVFAPSGMKGFVERAGRASVDERDVAFMREILCRWAAPEDVETAIVDAGQA